MKTALYCGALALAGAYFTAASAAEIEDFDHTGGGTFRSYPVNGLPLLDSFYFRFADGDERNIQSIQIELASPIPNPCFECGPVPAGQMFVSFQDDTEDDPYFFQISHAELPVPILRHRTAGYCKATCKTLLDAHNRGDVFVIVGFGFTYVGERDHHIQRVGLWEQDGVLEVHYRDENDDNLFRFDLEYVWLPAQFMARRGNASGVEAKGSAGVKIDLGPVAVGPTVLRGFDFVFLPELDIGLTYDQEIREIGVRTPGDRIEVYLDNGEQDRFDWGVDWGALALVPTTQPDPPRVPVKN